MLFAKQITFLLFALFTFALARPAPAEAHSLERRWRFRLYISGIIDIDIRTGKDVAKYDGSNKSYGTLVNNTAALQSSIASATSAQNQDPVGTQADSQDLVSYLSDSYEPETNKMVQAIIAQRSVIYSAKQQAPLLQQFKWIQGNQTLFNNAIVSKLPANQTLRAQAASVVKKIDADTSNLVAAFSG